MSRLRTRATALLLGLVGAGLTLVSLTTTWAQLGPGTAPGSELSGRQVAPAAFALGLAALAGVAVLLLVGRTGRRLVGALIALLGGGSIVAVWVGVQGMSDGSAWAVVATVGGLLVVLCGVLAAVFGGTWADASSRYSASGRPADTDLWRALDQGVDPTVDD